MPKTEAPAAPPVRQPPATKPKKGKKKLILVFLVLLLVVAGGGGAAYWKFVMSAVPADASAGTATDPSDPAKAAKDAHGMPEDPGMVAFEPFLVNLADEGSQSYLRVTLSLLVENEEEAKALEAKPVTSTRIRSTLLEVLATQTAAVLSTADGKTELKQTIKNKIKTLELGIEVYDVLFSDFVVQY